MAIKGQIRGLELGEVLLSIGKARSTGILTVQGEQEIVGISFLEGEVVSADALNQSLEEGLGQVLIERDLVQTADFQALTAEHQAGGDRVPDLLLDRGFLSRAELLDGLRTHTGRLCLEVLGWRSGEYKFYGGDEVSYEEGFEPIPVESLLVSAARELGPEGPLAGAIPPTGAVYRRVEDGEAAADFAEGEDVLSGLAKPGLEADLLLELIDGVRKVSDLVQETGLAESKVLLSLHQLRTAGRIRAVSEAGAPLEVDTFELPDLGGQEEGETPYHVEEVAAAGSRITSYIERRRALAANLAAWPHWMARSMAAVLVVVVIVLWALKPTEAIQPMPWLPAAKELHVREQWRAAIARFDRAATMFFLLEGRFPTRRGELAERGYIEWRDLEGPEGESVLYSATAVNYHLQAAEGPGALPAPEFQREIGGDFLLDPGFGRSRVPMAAPLVLVD